MGSVGFGMRFLAIRLLLSPCRLSPGALHWNVDGPFVLLEISYSDAPYAKQQGTSKDNCFARCWLGQSDAWIKTLLQKQGKQHGPTDLQNQEDQAYISTDVKVQICLHKFTKSGQLHPASAAMWIFV